MSAEVEGRATGATSPAGLRAVRLRHGPPLPAAFRHYQVSMPQAPGVDDLAVAVDMSQTDEQRLLGEVVARHWWSADHGQRPVRLASPAELSAFGEEHLAVEAMGLLDPALREEPGCPVEAVDPRRRHAWVGAQLLGSSPGRGWVPYSMAFPRWMDTRPGEPPTHPPFLSGLGAGASRAEAVVRAWEELSVEDALWTWWSDPCAPVLQLLPPEASAGPWQSDGLEIGLAVLPCSLGGSITVAVVDDGELTVLGGGPGTGRDGRLAAVARALWQLVMARALADPGNALHRAGGGAPGGIGALAPYRCDRRYLEQAGRRWRNLLDPIAHVQLLLDPVMREEIGRRIGRGTAGAAARRTAGGDRPGAPHGLDGSSSAILPAPTRPSCDAPGADHLPEGAVLPRGQAWVVDLGPGEGVRGSTHCVRLLVPGAGSLPLGAFPPDPRVAAAARARIGQRGGAPRAVPEAGSRGAPEPGPRGGGACAVQGPGQDRHAVGRGSLPYPGW